MFIEVTRDIVQLLKLDRGIPSKSNENVPKINFKSKGGVNMYVLVACEESQAVTKELRKLGHEAYSCDVQACSGGFPQWHITGDVLPLLGGYCSFVTSDGSLHCITGMWDMIIAFPPCTYLSFAGNRWLGTPGRFEKRLAAADFFMRFVNAPCEKIAIENPVGYMNSCYRKPDQIINPYQFGDSYRKRTCLWLKNLPFLQPDYVVPAPDPVYIDSKGKKRYWVETTSGQKNRSKTFPGIAAAMAWQWTVIL